MSRRLLRVAAPLLAGAVLATVSACGTVAEQSKEHSVVAGVETTLGSVLIRNATITLGPGPDSGQLRLVLFNEGSGPDALTGVTSPSFARAVLPSPSGPTGNGVALTSAKTVPLPARGSAFLNDEPEVITLTGISGGPRVGDSLPVTFQFEAAGSTTLQVPVTPGPGALPAGAETMSRNPSSAGLESYATQSPGINPTPTPGNNDE